MQEAPLPYNEEARLQELHQYEVLDTAAEDDIDDLTLLAAHLCDTPIALLSLVDSNRQWFKSKVGVSATETSRTIAFCAHSILQTDVFVVPDALADERFADNPLVTGEPGIRFYAGAPLITPGGYPLGTLCIIDRKARSIDSDQRDILRTLSRQVVRRLEQRRQVKSLHQAMIARKQAEDALRTSEERWQYAFEGSGDGVWDWNAQTNKVFFSLRWKTMLGYEADEIGDTLSEWESRVHPDDKAAVWEAIRKHFEGETELYINEHRVLCKDGSYKWILDRGKVIMRDAQGKPLRVVGTHTDLTERKEGEAKLRQSEAFLSSVLDNLPNMVFVKDAEELRFVRLNKAGEGLLGYSHHDLLGKNDYDFFTQNEAAQFIAADRRVLHDGYLLDIAEEPIQTKHQGVRYLHTKKIPLSDSNGAPRYLLGISEDITERKRMEEALRESHAELERRVVERTMDLAESNRALLVEIHERQRTEAALLETNKILQSVIDTSPLGVIGLDREGTCVTMWNSSAERIFGWSAGEIIGHPLPYVPAGEEGCAEAVWAQIVRDGVLHGIEVQRLRKDGTVVEVALWGVALQKCEATETGTFCFVADITERKQLEAIRRAHAVMDSVIQEREALMRNLHDGVLQSMYAVRLGLEHTRRVLASQPNNALQSLDAQIEDLALMIAEVRRFMVGQDPVWARSGNIRSGLVTLVDSYRGSMSVDWQLDLPDRDEEVADLSQDETRHLLYIAREALSNVVRHASATRCRITLATDGDRWRVTIEDNGQGFNPAESKRQGQGIGNMEARARQIGASLEIASIPGGGTQISIGLIRRAMHVTF